VLVLDRADRPGGRCATRSFGGTVADYGPLFLHGSDPLFLDAVRAAGAGPALEGWPKKVHGKGRPCQPRAFGRGETRYAMAEGVNAFPRTIAQGLPVELRTQVDGIEVGSGIVRVADMNKRRFESRGLVLALALEQALPFLTRLGPDRKVDGTLALLGMFSTVPCLTVIAGYEDGTEMPAWDIRYPEEDEGVLLVGNETAKRGGEPVLVVQATSRWSRKHLEEPKEAWAQSLLLQASRLLGSWAATPSWRHPHRWRYARMDGGNELAAPLVFALRGSPVGMCGELFSAEGGVQGAWRSGNALAERLGG